MLIVMGIFVIALGVVYQLILEPCAHYREQLRRDLQSKQIKLVKYRNLISRGADVKAMESKLTIAQPDKDYKDQSGLLKEIDRLAKKAEVKIVSMKPHTFESQTKSNKMEGVDLEFACTERSIIGFLYQIQKSPYLLKVIRLRLAISGNNSNASNLIARTAISRIPTNDH